MTSWLLGIQHAWECLRVAVDYILSPESRQAATDAVGLPQVIVTVAATAVPFSGKWGWRVPFFNSKASNFVTPCRIFKKMFLTLCSSFKSIALVFAAKKRQKATGGKVERYKNRAFAVTIEHLRLSVQTQ